MFKLDISNGVSSVNSENWEVVDRVPQDDDIICILEAFDVNNNGDFWGKVRQLTEFCKTTGETMPEIYGYKSTSKKPVLATDCKGIEFSAWYRDTVAKFVVKYAAKIQEYWWAYRRDRLADPGSHGLNFLKSSLGDDHMIPAYFEMVKTRRASDPKIAQYSFLANEVNNWDTSEAKKSADKIFEVYPLLGDDVSNLWNEYSYGTAAKRKDWINYVKQVDELNVLRSLAVSEGLESDPAEI